MEEKKTRGNSDRKAKGTSHYITSRGHKHHTSRKCLRPKKLPIKELMGKVANWTHFLEVVIHV